MKPKYLRALFLEETRGIYTTESLEYIQWLERKIIELLEKM